MVLPSHEEDEMLGQPRRKSDATTQGERRRAGRETQAGAGRETQVLSVLEFSTL